MSHNEYEFLRREAAVKDSGPEQTLPGRRYGDFSTRLALQRRTNVGR